MTDNAGLSVMAKRTGPKHPDIIIDSCIVARTRSGWIWTCRDCGEGSISGTGSQNLTICAAAAHTCPWAPTWQWHSS